MSVRRHLVSLAGAGVATVLAFGSLGGSGSDAPPDPTPVERVDVAPPDPDQPPQGGGEDTAAEELDRGPGKPEVGVFLDQDAATCEPGHTRVGADPSTHPDVPFVDLPSLEPPDVFQLDASPPEGDQAVLARGPGEGDLTRWCIDGAGLGQGPAVFSRLNGRFRVYATLVDNEVQGEVTAWSYSDDDPQERNVQELVIHMDHGIADGAVSADCPLQDMNAICPAGLGVKGAFDREKGRTGEWVWSSFDGVNEQQLKLYFRDDEPSGIVSIKTRTMGCTCTESGRMDGNGRQGAWRKRCTGEPCPGNVEPIRTFRDDVEVE